MERSVKKYDDSSLAAALRAIRSNDMGLRKASREFGVPVTTLHDRIKGKVLDSTQKKGPATVLTDSEEKKIVEWLLNIAKCGFPQKPNELLDVVQKIIKDDKRKTPFKEGKPGRKWYYGFLKRHKELSLRVSETVSKARAIVTEESIRKWFHDLNEFLEEQGCKDILLDPSRIYNGDETSFSLAPKTGAVIGPRGYKNLYQVKYANEKDNITVLLVFSAIGKILPPVVVFPYLRPPAKVVSSMPPDWIVGRSETGWMRTETFYEYVANDFNNWLMQNEIKKPILFLVDGHKSHLSLQISEFCRENGIILYSLPPNTTHILQPADVGAFKGLKSDYRVTVREWSSLTENTGKSITKTNFCEVLKIVLENKDRTEIIKNAFKKCGIYPFDPNSVDFSKCIQNRLESLNKGTQDINPANSDLSENNMAITKKTLLSLQKKLNLSEDVHFTTVLQHISEEEKKFPSIMEPEAYYDIGPSTSGTDGTGQIVSSQDNILEQYDIITEADYNITEAERLLQNNVLLEETSINNEIDEAIVQILDCDDIDNIDISLWNASPGAPMQITPVSSHRNSPSSTCSPFDRHLKFPKAIATKKGTKIPPEKRAPMAITSLKWMNFHQNIVEAKEKRKKDIEEKKSLRLSKKLHKKVKKTKNLKKSNQKQKCGACEDELDTDAEDDQLKNIGCDACDRWYHLGCTKLCALKFEEAKEQEFMCNLCS